MEDNSQYAGDGSPRRMTVGDDNVDGKGVFESVQRPITPKQNK